MTPIGTPAPYDCARDLSWVQNADRIDAAVEEILRMMFDLEIHPLRASEPVPLPPELESHEMDARTAIIGLSGALRGICQVRMNSEAAAVVASAMLGGETAVNDEALNDALGELCNMIAGCWKNGCSALATECILSPPTVISGGDYTVHVRRLSAAFGRVYCFGGHVLHFNIYREDE